LIPTFSNLEFFISFAFYNTMYISSCMLDMIQTPTARFPNLLKNPLEHPLGLWVRDKNSRYLSMLVHANATISHITLISQAIVWQ
jgi:hypothetical protein